MTHTLRKALRTHGLPYRRWWRSDSSLTVNQEVLGHSNIAIAITANLYAHVLMGLKREAAARMDTLLDAPGSFDQAVRAAS